MKVALVYDRVNKWGGAERLLRAMHEIWPNAPLYTGVHNPQTSKWAKDFDIRTTFVQNFPLAKTNHEYYPWLMTLGFESLSFDDYDVVISITSAEAKGIITKPNTLHICYCLTPTRYLWSHQDIYMQSINPALGALIKPVHAYLKKWDKIAAARPDYYVSISKHVQNRVLKHYGRESEVVYPPIDSEWVMGNGKWVNSKNTSHITHHTSPYLIVSRLVPYKKVDIAIEACKKLKLPLIIIGDGVEKRRLQRIAGSTIKFISGLTDKTLLRYYQGCRALIMPQEEDFGLVALEAQAAGKPVIAYNYGGAKETVVAGKTGEFFNKQTPESLIVALRKFDTRKYKRKDCIENASKFSKKIFKIKFSQYIKEKYGQFMRTRNT
jgi:glycosyltransferase involved in cell wall biosynthesis